MATWPRNHVATWPHVATSRCASLSVFCQRLLARSHHYLAELRQHPLPCLSQSWTCVGPERRSCSPGTFRTCRTMFPTFLGMFRTCSQDPHAQQWLRQAQLMHAQHWPRTQSRSRQGGGCPPPPCSHLGPRPLLSMHELSLSMPEPMLSLSMLILAAS